MNREEIEIIVLGEKGCGKTNLIHRFLNESTETSPTLLTGLVAPVYSGKTVSSSDGQFSFKICDTTLDKKSRFLLPLFSRSGTIALVCYSTIQEDSYERARGIVKELKQSEPSPSHIILVGTMIDLSSARKVSLTEAEAFAKFEDISFIETSAESGTNIEELFALIANLTLQKDENSLKKSRSPKIKDQGPSFSSSVINILEEDLELDEEIETKIETKPEWEIDHQAKCCNNCGLTFTFFIRRHHCRKCGKIFCFKCSSNFIALPQVGLKDPQRVCSNCLDKIRATQ